MNQWIRAFWLCCMLAGCASTPENRYYRLSSAFADGANSIPTTVSPGPVDSAVTVDLPALLDHQEIISGTGAHTVALRESDRWAAPLDEMVPRVLREDLSLAEVRCHADDERLSPGWHLMVHVDEFMAEADGTVRLDGDWTLFSGPGEGSVPQIRRFALTDRADPRNMGAVVAMMSNLLEQLAEAIESRSRTHFGKVMVCIPGLKTNPSSGL